MNVLLLPLGSHGDVHPFVGLGLALRRRGHAVTVACNGHFRGLVEKTEMPFVEVGSAEEYVRSMDHPDLWHPRRSFAYVFRVGIAPAMRPQYEVIAEHAARGPLLVIGNSLGFGALVAREKLGVPLVTVHLQPVILWSEHESPKLPGLSRGPRWWKRFLFWFAEKFVVDRITAPTTNRFRAELGLPPMRRTMHWWHSPDLVLGMFPEWYAPPQPDWPANVVLTRFPLWDEGDVTPVAPEVERFLTEGDPPLVFTPGSSNRQAADFFAAAAEACRSLNRRGMLLSRFREQVPADLPDAVRHFDYVPFGKLLPRAAALAHHGGIGTTAQGLRAGVPQLLMPLAHDQPDNAARIRKLGVGDWLPPSRFRGPAVAEVLGRLLASGEVREACRRVAARFGDDDPFGPSCDAIEGLMARRSPEGREVACGGERHHE
jgi:UDP:flavonoid glycosyltransferase YjiC (YdhE family)